MSEPASAPAPPPPRGGHGPCRPLRWAAGGGASAVLVAALVVPWLPAGDRLSRENGVFEMVSVACWILSVLVGGWTVLRASVPEGRLLALWTAGLAGLAALRELDAHVWLNPGHLGAWGVRYRLDWWMNTHVSVWLRLGWAVVLLAGGLGVVCPPWKLRGTLGRLVRQGDLFAGLLGLAVIFLAFGFVIDDILRPVRFVSGDLKQLLEEASETVGAVLYLAGMVVAWRAPVPITAGRPGPAPAGSGS